MREDVFVLRLRPAIVLNGRHCDDEQGGDVWGGVNNVWSTKRGVQREVWKKERTEKNVKDGL